MRFIGGIIVFLRVLFLILPPLFRGFQILMTTKLINVHTQRSNMDCLCELPRLDKVSLCPRGFIGNLIRMVVLLLLRIAHLFRQSQNQLHIQVPALLLVFFHMC
jgi:hypothetical protein